MSSYTVTHINPASKTITRPLTFLNPHYSPPNTNPSTTDAALETFHRQLPDYGETPLHSLPSIAAELGFKHVFVKDESTRFGLPSFKILGASWAIHRAVCKHLSMPPSTTLTGLQEALAKGTASEVRIVTCTDGNWGRACARMAKYLRVPVTVYVPGFMIESTQNLMRSEGAEVKVVANGSYDDAIAAVQHDMQRTGALMVMDTSWEGYEEVPGWVTEGYKTTLLETDRQLRLATSGLLPTLVIGSVGVGSWMHAVTTHYSSRSKVATVEPDTAACLKESLHTGRLTSIETGNSIMCGMNCGTPSTIAWPILRDGVWAAVAVTDREAHGCVEELEKEGVNAGPCGAATLAALRRLCARNKIQGREGGVVVLFSTEGGREYDVPV
ncbi:hypothetical protein LTR08_005742 [Meristemomyces frigidus]|nr:hypothetical protein LTR08_005742 [Meristemomyces frigidus]